MSTAGEPSLDRPSAFSIATGGELARWLERIHLGGHGVAQVARRIVALVGLTWVPLLVATLAEGTFVGAGRTSFAWDVAVHARSLVGLPLLLVAERTLGRRLQHALAHLEDAGIVTSEHEPRVGRLVTRACAARDSRLVELAILASVVALAIHDAGAPVLPAWVLRGSGLSLAGWIELAWSTPLYRVLLVRWLWRWVVWCFLLAGLARAGLRLSALHSDRKGGLGVLAEAHTSTGWLLTAVGATLAGSFTMERHARGLSVTAFHDVVAAFCVLGPLVCIAPMLAFVWPLEVARRRAQAQYAIAAAEFARRYEGAHLDPQRREPVEVGSADPSSAEDLGGSFERMLATRRIPIDRTQLAFLVACALAPLVAFYLEELPLTEIFRRLRSALG